MRATIARINTANLRHNFRQIRDHARNASIMAVIKANAYGHGIVECARIFSGEGARMLGVAFAHEAIEIRKAGILTPILVMSPPLADEAESYCKLGLEFVACDFNVVQAFSATAQRLGVELNAHLYIDTGLSRDGVLAKDAREFMRSCRDLPALRFSGLCTHFATSDEQDNSFMYTQHDAFSDVIRELRTDGFDAACIHAANSGAIADFPKSHCTMVRPGSSLYGYSASEFISNRLQLRPALEVRTKINALRRVPPHTSVSYGRRYYTTAETTIATIPIGYADGLFRSLGGKAQCIIGGAKYTIAGTICMDECMVDVGNARVSLGDDVVLIGSQGSHSISASDVAQLSGTIHYEVLAAISARVPRIFCDNDIE